MAKFLISPKDISFLLENKDGNDKIPGIKGKEDVLKLCQLLKTSAEGMSSASLQDISDRFQHFGNYSVSPSPSFGQLLSKSFQNFQPKFIRNILLTIMFLYTAALILLFRSEIGNSDDESENGFSAVLVLIVFPLLHPFLIFGTVLVVYAVLNYKMERENANKLRDVIETVTYTVKRDGEEKKISIMEMVVGDIYQAHENDVIPISGVVLSDDVISLKEYNIEENCVTKTTKRLGSDPFCYPGSIVYQGKADILVLEVVRHKTEEEEIDLQLRPLLSIALIFGLITFSGKTFTFLVTKYIVEAERWEISHLQKFVTFFSSGLDVAAELIPFSISVFIPLVFYNVVKKSNVPLRNLTSAYNLATLKEFTIPTPTTNVLELTKVRSDLQGLLSYSIARFLQYWLTIFIPLVAVSLLFSLRISGIQHSWLVFVVTLLAFLTFYDESKRKAPACKEVVPKSYIATKRLWTHVVGQCFYFALVTKIIVRLVYNTSAKYLEVDSKTMFFNTVALTATFLTLTSRMSEDKLKFCSGMRSKKSYWVAVICIFFAQVGIVQYAGLAASTSPLNLMEWLWCVFVALGALLLDLVLEIISQKLMSQRPLRSQQDLEMQDMGV